MATLDMAGFVYRTSPHPASPSLSSTGCPIDYSPAEPGYSSIMPPAHAKQALEFIDEDPTGEDLNRRNYPKFVEQADLNER